MVKLRCLFFILTLTFAFQALAWNALGHQLIAQIAYDNLSSKAREKIEYYNQVMNRIGRRQSVVSAASWMDTLRINNDLWLEECHYINQPFSRDNTPLLPPKKLNAIVAIRYTQGYLASPTNKTFPARYLTLQSKNASKFLRLKKMKRLKGSEAANRALIYDLLHNPDPQLQKALSIRLLFHVVGDLHQPLHAVSHFDKHHKEGDRGGNLYFLRGNMLAKNLHAYWDKGGGFLLPAQQPNKKYIKKRARQIEKRNPCHWQAMNLDPETWALESRQLAMDKAYRIKSARRLEKAYQLEVKAIAEQRIALAGCRLAGVINRL